MSTKFCFTSCLINVTVLSYQKKSTPTGLSRIVNVNFKFEAVFASFCSFSMIFRFVADIVQVAIVKLI